MYMSLPTRIYRLKNSNGSTGEGGGEKSRSMAEGKEDDVQGLWFGNVRSCISTAIFSLLIVLLYDLSWQDEKENISLYIPGTSIQIGSALLVAAVMAALVWWQGHLEGGM